MRSDATSEAWVGGEAPQALPVEGALKPATETSEARVRGEAPQALPVEGALSPNNWRATRR
jgi:hypothetical protein